MYQVTGYFNEKGDAYTLTTPKTRGNYRTCLQNNKGYKVELNQFGMGETVCRFKLSQECNVLENGQRTIYFRDDENKDVWCVGGFPFVSEVTEFQCTHKQSCTEISSVHNGVRVTIMFFVAFDKHCDIQSVKVENLSDKERKISIFPAAMFDMTGYKAPRFANSPLQSYLTSFKEEINGLFVDIRNPYASGMPYCAYLTSTTTVTSYSADDREVFGTQYSLSQPYAVLEEDTLDSRPMTAGKVSALLQTSCILQLGEAFETDYVLGIAKDFEMAQKELSDVKTHMEVVELYHKTAEADRKRRERLFIDTPHAETNSQMNYWLKIGLEANIFHRTNPRDNIQFANAGLLYMPEATRFTLLAIMTQQYQDGHMVRSWMPVDECVFADEPMWLVYAICDYIKYTEDTAFLEEVVEYRDGGCDTVWVHLLKAVHRVDADRGPHNIPLSHFADWNDALNTGIGDENAESVFVAMQLANAFQEMSGLCAFLGKEEQQKKYEDKYEALKNTINECCWDEEGYYVRSFTQGMAIGSSKCEKGAKIYTNPQAWSFISGVCPEERRTSVMEAVDHYLDTPVGCRVNYPAYSEADPLLGRISFQYPGAHENGAIYAHATSFKMYGDCMIGEADRAYRSYQQLLPSNPDNPPELADTVPYAISSCCFTADVCYGKSSAMPFGTGTQAWMFRTVIEGFLGIRLTYGGFKLEPVFPSEWDKAAVTLERFGTKYHFTYSNRNTGTKKIFINGVQMETDVIPFTKENDLEIKIEL